MGLIQNIINIFLLIGLVNGKMVFLNSESLAQLMQVGYLLLSVLF